METLILKDGSRWIKKNPLIDYWHNLEDYENWLMDVSLNFGKVRGMSGISMRIKINKLSTNLSFGKNQTIY
jgi:hypothetical protein